MEKACKIPVSTLVVVYTPRLDVLLIERADRTAVDDHVALVAIPQRGKEGDGDLLRGDHALALARDDRVDQRDFALFAADRGCG